MASSIVTVKRQRKAKTASQGTAAAKDIVPNKPKLQPLTSGSVHEGRASKQAPSLKMAVLNSPPLRQRYIDPKLNSYFFWLKTRRFLSAELPLVGGDLARQR